MKITIAIPCLNRGGTEMQTLSLVRVLEGTGHSVTTLCYFEHDPEMVREFQKAGCIVELLNLERSISPFKLTVVLRGVFKKQKPDVVHVQYMAPGAVPILAARLAGVKHLFATVHQPWTKHFHGTKAKLLLRIASWLTTRFIVVSETAEFSWFGSSLLYEIANEEPFHGSHFTIHNAIDLDRVDLIIKAFNRTEAKEKLGITNNIVIGAVSRLSREKGIELLLEAFSLIQSSDERLRLLVVGNGPEEANLKLLAKNREIEDKVLFPGHKNWDEAIQLISLMDLVVCPSRFEGFGLTAAEAMACGKPVVANNTGGLKEVISHNRSGLLVNASDPVELAGNIRMLTENPLLMEEMGRLSRQAVETKFSFPLFAGKINQLYSRL